MGVKFDACQYSNISTCIAILTAPGFVYGIALIPATTGVVTCAIYDAKATATGTGVCAFRAASTAGMNSMMLSTPIACRTGIFASVSCTSGADQVIVFYRKA
jgi:hypothetical protein